MNSNILATIVAYYFSKYDKEGIKILGFKSDSEAFETVAYELGVKKNYVKFRRDEFDAVHPWRKGWQRPMANSMVRTIEALQELSEENLRSIVKNIIIDENYRESEGLQKITALITDGTESKKTREIFVLRGPTGKKAEEYFIEYHKTNSKPETGTLNDTREYGCGYDFEIIGANTFYIEVKGLANKKGGILFTNKEWKTAKKFNNKYILVIVSNLDSNPEIKFVYDPASVFQPQKNIVTTVQVQWNVSSSQINQV